MEMLSIILYKNRHAPLRYDKTYGYLTTSASFRMIVSVLIFKYLAKVFTFIV